MASIVRHMAAGHGTKLSSALQEREVFQGKRTLIAVRWGDLVIHTFPKSVDSEEKSLWVWDQREFRRPASATV